MAAYILIAEDDFNVRDALCETLQDDLVVICVANGAEALRHLESHAPPCLILLDLMMPVMDGWTRGAGGRST